MADGVARPEFVVYHPAYGLRPAILEFAGKLRAARSTRRIQSTERI